MCRNEVINVNLVSKPEWYFERNPLGKVPCLEFDGNLVFESLITADYLDEVYPEPSLNSPDPLQKAKDRIFVELFNKINGAMYKLYVSKGDEQVGKRALESIDEGLVVFEREIVKRGTPFYGGQKPGMLDYSM